MNSIIIITLLTLFISCSNINNEEKSSEIKKKDATDKLISKEDFLSLYRFSDYTSEIYKGDLMPPDFTNNPYAADKEYFDFIAKGCKLNGINFGRSYTVLEKGCGAMCSHIFIIDRKNGNIFTDVKLQNGSYGYKYKAGSNLLIANYFTLEDADKGISIMDSLLPMAYVWENKSFKSLKISK